MTDEHTIINLPFFPGFYESILSQTLDHTEEREAEYRAEEETGPKELQLDARDFSQCLFDAMNYRSAYHAMAKDYCDAFDHWANDNLETPLGSFVFESMDSPREYNFTTDRVYVSCPMSVVESLRAHVDIVKLSETIAERHTSRSGFISFYDNDLEEWLSKPIEDWDHNELGTLLVAAMAPHIDTESDFNWSLCEPLFEADYEYIDEHCDWDKYEAKVAAMRAEKLEDWAEYAPEEASAYALGEPTVSRCPLTLELPFPDRPHA